jgi:peptidyl-prolyl cis-trans isomerase SurA
MQLKKLMIAVLILLIIGLGAWLYFSNGEEGAEVGELPDVVARVNNEDITLTDLENFETQILLGQGISSTDDLDEADQENLRAQALDMLVSNVLIWQATTESGITATEDEIDAQLETIKGQFQDEDQYQEALLQEGMSETGLRSQLATELATQKYIEANLDMDSLTVSEEEINALYEQEASSAENVPPLSEIRGQIESFVIQQKQGQMYNEHVQELRNQADIEILI